MKCKCNECPNRPCPPSVFNGIFGALGVCVCKAPYVNTETGTWWEYDPSARAFVDTGVLANGAGAYELAVQYGYTGTEEDFAGLLLSAISEQTEVISEEINPDDLIKFEDNNKLWKKVTISTLAACIAEIIGSTGGDGHWSVDDGRLIPDRDLNLDNGDIINIAKLFFGSGSAAPFAVGVRNLTALPNSAPTDESEYLIYLTTEERYYRYNETLSEWQKLPTLGDIDTHAITRLSTYANFEDLPVSASLQQYLARLSKWYNVINNKQDAESGKGLSTNDFDNAAKAKVDAIPANPKYTDTVYDDTALAARVSTIEGKERGWDDKYSKPAGGIPASDLASGVIPPVMTGATSGAAGSAGLVPAPAAGDNVKFLRGDGIYAVPPGGSGSSATTVPVVDELSSSEIVEGTLTATEDGGLTLTIEREGPQISLDDTAWESLSYRDIFITHNLSPVRGLEEGLSDVSGIEPFIHAGSPARSSEASATGSYSLKCFGSGNQLYKCSGKASDIGMLQYRSYYTAFMGKCTRHVAGVLAVFVSSADNGAKSVEAVTQGFERVSNLYNAPNSWIPSGVISFFWGSWGASNSADLDGYIDDIVIVDMSIFTNSPTKAQMDELYDGFRTRLRANGGSSTTAVTWNLASQSDTPSPSPSPSIADSDLALETLLRANAAGENTAIRYLMDVALTFWEHRAEFVYCSGTALDTPWDLWSRSGKRDINTNEYLAEEDWGYKCIDCSTFARYVLNGISYYSTPYYNALEDVDIEQGALTAGVEAASTDPLVCRSGAMYVRKGKALTAETKSSSYVFNGIYGYTRDGTLVDTYSDFSAFTPSATVAYIRAEMTVTVASEYADGEIIKYLRIREDETPAYGAGIPVGTGYRDANRMCKWLDDNGYNADVNPEIYEAQEIHVGSAIFWGRTTSANYKGITHVSVNIGAKYLIHATINEHKHGKVLEIAPHSTLFGDGRIMAAVDDTACTEYDDEIALIEEAY